MNFDTFLLPFSSSFPPSFLVFFLFCVIYLCLIFKYSCIVILILIVIALSHLLYLYQADTIEYFSSIVNNPCIGNASIILLFNKIDIFEKKYIKKKIKDVKCFQNYRGSSMSYFDGVTYFLNLFINQVNNSIKENGKIHHFVTNLLDTEITNHVINRYY